VDRVLGGNFPVKTVAMLALLKIVATPLCYSSGNAGGIFGPSLFIGAMIGGTVGGVAHNLFPAVTASPGAYALVGMGAAFAGIVRTPMTSVIMIFEMTRDYAIIVPLMIANMISFAISRVLQPEPIYEALALQEGVHLPKSEARRASEGLRVGAIMDRAARPMAPETGINQAIAFLDEARVNSWPVGAGSRVHGVVNVRQVQNADHVLTVGDLISLRDRYPHAHSDHHVTYALDRMRHERLDALAVVSRADIHELQGVVTLAGILASYGLEGKRSPVRPAWGDSE
jgi:CIC family chloride channel protein